MALAPSFPEVHVTGPVHHCIKLWGEGTPFYLGTAEVTPQMQIRTYRTNTMNDIAGKTLPFQKHWDGQAATVSVLLTRFSKEAVRQLKMIAKNSDIHLSPGNERRWARGSLVYPFACVTLWQVYDNFVNPFGASTGLEPGYVWFQAEVLQMDEVKLGTQGQGLLCVFDCTPQWIPQASSTAVNDAVNERGWSLYSQSEDYFDGTIGPAVQIPQ